MANIAQACEVVCPYYRTQTAQSITCEGFWKGTRVLIWFGPKRDLDKFQRQRCMSFDYLQCPYARILEIKYQKREQRGA